ncbi:MAG: glutaredoxin family protein [Terriglobia bacterium]
MKQQCYLAMIYLNWIVLAGGLGFFIFKGFYVLALAWLALLPLAMWAYIRVFPSLSQFMGYGRVDDQPAQRLGRVPTKVTLYTALGCPFCPVVKRRLMALREQMEFSLEEVDVTLDPGLLIAKGIRAVPVVEAGDRRLAGNATSEQLAELISGTAPSQLAN